MLKARMDLNEHLAKEHNMSPFRVHLKEIVYGGNDGIVTTFAVVAGYAGAHAQASLASHSVGTVLLFGLANLFADAASMSLGSFLSLRAEKDVYGSEKSKELYEIRHEPGMEFEETIEILTRKGYDRKDATALAKLYAKNEKYWSEFMMHHELELPNPEKENPWRTALATFLSFVSFGFIPLLPYIVLPHSGNLFAYSVLFTASALLLLGILRYHVISRHPARAIGETLLIGGVSASIAYFVGTFFR